jgi:hypothetical protein
MARTSASARPLTDHEEIRRWAEARGAKPTCVRGTGNNQDVGMIRLDFPGYSGEGKLEEISWDEWFDKFDESGLALLVQDETARGQRSNFNKLVSRDTAESSERGRSSRSGGQSQSRSRNGRRSEGRGRETYAASRGRENAEDNASEGYEEEVDIEIKRPVRARIARPRGRKRQGRASSSRTTRSARGGSRTSDASRSRSRGGAQRATSSRNSRSRRGRATGGSRSSSKKAPARARSSSRSSRSNRGGSSHRRAA